MSSTTLTPSLKTFLSGIVAFLISVVCLLMPASPDNVNLTVKGGDHGTEDVFGDSFCFVTVQMEKPDYATLEKEIGGEWMHIAKGKIPQEDHWTMIHGGDTTETFYFFLENETVFAPGKYKITVHYDITGLTSKTEGKSSTVFTVD